ncbi:MAG: response regulator transcription factor [Syntrophorhabdaceae bacterium]|nr:response regulator transcription factor [Syntrophorhabdaceae bacterium]
MKLFIADDSEMMRERIRELALAVEGIELVGEAGDVRASIKGILDLKPDVVILDIRMPGGSGLDVLREMKRHLKTPLIIVLTNYPFPEYKEIAIKLGANHFFDKATEFDEVQRALERMLQDKKVKEKSDNGQ